MRVEVQDLHRSFGEKKVLQGISLEIPENQITLIVGRSGCGKSVLLKHMIGLLKPDQGDVLVDGLSIVGRSERDLREVRRRFGLVFQMGALLNSMTVGENVGLGISEFHTHPQDKIREIVLEKLDLVGLADEVDKKPAELSGGMRKRVAIARALALDAETLLYDEPTTGLDPPMATAIDEVILDLSKRFNKTTVVVTHDLVSIFSIADHVAMIHEGRVIFHGTPDEMKRDPQPVVKEFIARR